MHGFGFFQEFYKQNAITAQEKKIESNKMTVEQFDKLLTISRNSSTGIIVSKMDNSTIYPRDEVCQFKRT